MTIGIVYYSRTGNSRTAAELIAQKLKEKGETAELVEIHTAKKPSYLKAGYCGSRQKELPITNTGFDLAGFDALIVGCPIWAGKPAPVVKTFFEKAVNGRGKKVAFYVSCGGAPGSQSDAPEVLKKHALACGFLPLNTFLALQMMTGDIKDGIQLLEPFVAAVLKK